MSGVCPSGRNDAIEGGGVNAEVRSGTTRTELSPDEWMAGLRITSIPNRTGRALMLCGGSLHSAFWHLVRPLSLSRERGANGRGTYFGYEPESWVLR